MSRIGKSRVFSISYRDATENVLCRIERLANERLMLAGPVNIHGFALTKSSRSSLT